MARGSTECPRWPRGLPQALALPPEYSSLAALNGPFLSEGLPEASLLLSYPALKTGSFLPNLPSLQRVRCPSGLSQEAQDRLGLPFRRGWKAGDK